jgi:hypothetical protein
MPKTSVFGVILQIGRKGPSPLGVLQVALGARQPGDGDAQCAGADREPDFSQFDGCLDCGPNEVGAGWEGGPGRARRSLVVRLGRWCGRWGGRLGLRGSGCGRGLRRSGGGLGLRGSGGGLGLRGSGGRLWLPRSGGRLWLRGGGLGGRRLALHRRGGRLGIRLGSRLASNWRWFGCLRGRLGAWPVRALFAAPVWPRVRQRTQDGVGRFLAHCSNHRIDAFSGYCARELPSFSGRAIFPTSGNLAPSGRCLAIDMKRSSRLVRK